MSFDIFRVNWFLVDTIIIILFLIFLLGVKIYKNLFRWRNKIVNPNLTQEEINLLESKMKLEGFRIYKSFMLKNALNNDKLSIKMIIAICFKKSSMLFNSLLEGLSSRGYDVLSLFLSPQKKYKNDMKRGKTYKKIAQLLQNIINEYIDLSNNPKFSVICYEEPIFLLDVFKNHPSCLKYISINPRFPLVEIINLYEQTYKKSSLQDYIVMVNFHSRLFLNLKLKLKGIKKQEFIDLVEKERIIMIKSNKKFKYHETILFGYLLKKLNEN